MITLYLNGERIPTAKVRRRMLDALGWEWDDIFYIIESDKSQWVIKVYNKYDIDLNEIKGKRYSFDIINFSKYI